ncbi:hypothetical protein N9D31_00025 [Oligoflexaceae bacterium]|nr:hypothetical protein [Oligoflexaceae bacterium]
MTESAFKRAKKCRTREHWNQWHSEFSGVIEEANDSRSLEDIFKLLEKDAQSLIYGVDIWASLLEGCISSWNLELGVRIAEFTLKLKSPRISIAVAKIHLESGFPGKARQIVTQALRSSQLQPKQKLQLEMLNCSAYIEEGNRQQAARSLKRIEKSATNEDLSKRDQADFLTYAARTLFLLGRYKEASRIFERISEVYFELELWENAAKAYFNAAASLENGGEGSREFTFNLVEKSRRISEEHNLKGTLAHCEAFYGHNDYWRGNFGGAREHYRKALQQYPSSDNSYRRLHLLSMLAFTYLRTGRFHLARKFGQMTLDLASHEETDRFSIRYDNLEAELLWESGEFEASQSLLQKSTTPLLQKGVNTLEDLAIVSRFIFQSAMLGETNIAVSYKIGKDIDSNTAAKQEYTHALGHYWLAQHDFQKAKDCFNQCLELSMSIEDRYHRAQSYLGLIEIAFLEGESNQNIEDILRKFEIYAGRMVETPLKSRTKIILAGLAYRQGDFERAVELVKSASKTSRLSFTDDFITKSWISTIEGKSPRIPSDMHENLLARMTRVYFRPSIEVVSKTSFRISGHYNVDLSKQKSLAEILNFLLAQEGKCSTPEDLQKNVWKQSTDLQGWQQKIRNTLNRLRPFLKFSVAPLIVHDSQVRLFDKAIDIKEAKATRELGNEKRIVELLKKTPQSTKQLSKELSISAATTKRILSQLSKNEKITSLKIGRNVFYKFQN